MKYPSRQGACIIVVGKDAHYVGTPEDSSNVGTLLRSNVIACPGKFLYCRHRVCACLQNAVLHGEHR